jgi:hypothetical protein
MQFGVIPRTRKERRSQALKPQARSLSLRRRHCVDLRLAGVTFGVVYGRRHSVLTIYTTDLYPSTLRFLGASHMPNNAEPP